MLYVCISSVRKRLEAQVGSPRQAGHDSVDECRRDPMGH